jgi:hypothetical protein
MRSETFGRLLKAAIGSIVAHEGVTAPVVEEDLARQMGRSAASIQRYKAGHIPPEPSAVELLARAAVARGCLNRAWLTAFLRAARHPSPAGLIDSLYPERPEQPAAAGGPVATNLPAPPYAQFVPRPAPYAELLEGLAQRAAVVLLAGMGGVGKTSLAHELAAACVAGSVPGLAFAAVVWVSDQDDPGATTLAAMLNAIARTLDYPALLGQELEERRRSVEALLRRRPALLVIDNAETVEDGALLRWLPRLPEPSKALVTSRAVRRELLRSCWLVELGGLGPDEGRALLALRLRALRLAADGPALARLAPLLGAVGGNPKALEVALGALKYGTATPAQLVEALDAATGAPFDELFMGSWALLDGAARRLLLALTLFGGAAPGEALAAAADLQGVAYARALELLIDLALVSRQGEVATARYGLHPLVRAFAGARLRELPGFEREARERQLAWYAALAERVGYCWDDLGRLALLDPERETLTGLIRWYAARGRQAELAQLLRGVDYFYYIRGLWAEAADISGVRAAVASQIAGPEEAARSLAYHLQMLCRQGQREAAAAQLPRLLALAEAHALPADVRFEVYYTQALDLMLAGDHARAAALWREALPLAAEVSARAHAVAQGWLARCCYRLGRAAEARALWEDLLRDAEAGRFQRGAVSAEIGLARLDLDRGELGAARGRIDRARRLAARYGDRGGLAELDGLDARYYQLSGDEAAAEAANEAARDALARIGATADLASI